MKTKETIETNSPVRYNMNSITYRRLCNDHIRFEHKYASVFKNAFLCKLLTNYLCFFQHTNISSVETSITKCLNGNYKMKKGNSGRLSVSSALAKKIKEFDFYKDKNFNKSAVFSFILEKFSSMPFSEREKVYFYDIYSLLANCINNLKMIRIEYKEKDNKKEPENKTYDIIPYDIVVDDNSFSYYLIGYAKDNSIDSDYMIRSFKLSRIISCRSTHKDCSLKKVIKYKIQNKLAKYGAAYIEDNDNPSEIIVRLSKKGYELFFTSIARQRPVPITEPEPDKEKTGFYILKFDCSYSQIRNYFFSFGEDAEVLSPTEFREKFIRDYNKALKLYSE